MSLSGLSDSSLGEEVILTPPVKRIASSKMWCFTLNNWTMDELSGILEVLKSEKYVIGKEVGESGTPHLQGYINFKKASRPMEKFECKRIHWEKCKGSEADNIAYCSKDGNFLTNGLKVPRPIVILKEEQLRDWQLEIIDIISNPANNRTIHWYWETSGHTGKTTFCKYLVQKYSCGYLNGGSSRDSKFFYVMNDFDCYLFDLPRSCEEGEGISYQALEEIKNGIVYCGKYEAKSVCRNCPHVFVFANFEPDCSKLSADRWHIRRIVNNCESL